MGEKIVFLLKQLLNGSQFPWKQKWFDVSKTVMNYLTEIVKVQPESQIPFPSNFKDSWVSISSPQKKQRLSFAQVIYFLSKLDQLP